MKKAKKKQLVLSVLVLALSVAVYLNWQFSNSGGRLDIGDSIWTSGSYGEAEFVSAKTDENKKDAETVAKDSSYFETAKTNRAKTRDEALDTLQKALKDTSITTSEKESLTNSLSYIVSSIEKEGKIEALVKAKGVADCIVFINNDKCDAVIRAQNTDGVLINQIKEIIVRESGISAENISITETK